MNENQRRLLARQIVEIMEERIDEVARYDALQQAKIDRLEAQNLELINEINALQSTVRVVEPMKPGEWYIGRLAADGSFNPVRPLVV